MIMCHVLHMDGATPSMLVHAKVATTIILMMTGALYGKGLL